MILVGRITREVNEICFTAPMVRSNVIVIVDDFGQEMIYVVVTGIVVMVIDGTTSRVASHC